MVLAESCCDQTSLFKLLLNTAQLELVTKELYKGLMSEKDTQWQSLQEATQKGLLELAHVFSGAQPLSRVKQNEDLEKWFREIGRQVQELTREDSGSSMKLVQLIQALEDVQEFEQMSSNMQVLCLSGVFAS